MHAAVLLLDPVAIGLQEPDVCFNFLYKPVDPRSAIHVFFRYFVSSELGACARAHTVRPRTYKSMWSFTAGESAVHARP